MFWERFYDMCKRKGLKPNPLAREIGVSSGIISKWKNDGRLPNGETLTKIANALNCSVDYLLGITDCPAPCPGTIDDTIRLYLDSWGLDSKENGYHYLQCAIKILLEEYKKDGTNGRLYNLLRLDYKAFFE